MISAMSKPGEKPMSDIVQSKLSGFLAPALVSG